MAIGLVRAYRRGPDMTGGGRAPERGRHEEDSPGQESSEAKVGRLQGGMVAWKLFRAGGARSLFRAKVEEVRGGPLGCKLHAGTHRGCSLMSPHGNAWHRGSWT